MTMRGASIPPPRAPAAILADLDALHVRQRDLYDELARAGSTGSGARRGAPDVEGPIVTRQQAAAAIGWREERLVAAIVRHNAAHPNDPLGWQAGGNRRARWEIPLGRLKRWVRNGSM